MQHQHRAYRVASALVLAVLVLGIGFTFAAGLPLLDRAVLRRRSAR